MTQHHAHHARGHVEVVVAVDIGEPDATPAGEHDPGLETPTEDVRRVARHQVVMGVGKLELHRHCASSSSTGAGLATGAGLG